MWLEFLMYFEQSSLKVEKKPRQTYIRMLHISQKSKCSDGNKLWQCVINLTGRSYEFIVYRKCEKIKEDKRSRANNSKLRLCSHKEIGGKNPLDTKTLRAKKPKMKMGGITKSRKGSILIKVNEMSHGSFQEQKLWAVECSSFSVTCSLKSCLN